MVQSESSSKRTTMETKTEELPPLPSRSFTTEFYVGAFTLIGVISFAYLAAGLGEVRLFGRDTYTVFAEFDNISGLKEGASVEIAGVKIGTVTDISLNDPYAIVRLEVRNDIKINDDDIAAIRTKGIIGDRFVKLSRGSSGQFLAEGAKIMETESVVDFEDLIGKFIHNMESGDKK